MENGMPTRQQPDQRHKQKSLRPPMGLRHSEKIPHPETDFSWPIIKKVYYLSEYRASHETPKHKYKPKLKKNRSI